MLIGITRHFLNKSRLPRFLWDEATPTSSYLYNRTPTNAIAVGKPYGWALGTSANLSHVRIVRPAAYVHVEGQKNKLSGECGRESESTRRREPVAPHLQHIYKPRVLGIKSWNVRFIESPVKILNINSVAQEGAKDKDGGSQACPVENNHGFPRNMEAGRRDNERSRDGGVCSKRLKRNLQHRLRV